MDDREWFDETRNKVIETRERVTGALRQRGFEVLPSQANFVFARHAAHSGEALAKGLRERAVLVRHFAKPRISEYLRITIGTPEECDRLISAVEEIV